MEYTPLSNCCCSAEQLSAPATSNTDGVVCIQGAHFTLVLQQLSLGRRWIGGFSGCPPAMITTAMRAATLHLSDNLCIVAQLAQICIHRSAGCRLTIGVRASAPLAFAQAWHL